MSYLTLAHSAWLRNKLEKGLRAIYWTPSSDSGECQWGEEELKIEIKLQKKCPDLVVTTSAKRKIFNNLPSNDGGQFQYVKICSSTDKSHRRVVPAFLKEGDKKREIHLMTALVH